jgi:hypothetical protein
LIAFRPAATFRRVDSGLILRTLNTLGFDEIDMIPQVYKSITSKPGSLKLGVEDIEWVTCGIRFGRGKIPAGDTHMFTFIGPTIRTAVPFDWLAFLRQGRCIFAEGRYAGRTYYKLTEPWKQVVGSCVCLLDDRTVVFDEEEAIRAYLGRESSQPPACFRGPAWELASRGLLAVTINNEDGAFAKQYDLGQPDDAVTLSLFKGVNHWTLWIDDADAVALHAVGACGAGEVSKTISGEIDSLLKSARAGIEQPDPKALAAAQEREYRIIRTLVTNIRVERTERSVEVRTDGFGTLAEIGSLITAEADAKGDSRPGRTTPGGSVSRQGR